MGSVFLYSIIGILLLALLILACHTARSSRQLREACRVLDDIAAGNIHRRIVAEQGNMAAELCHKINDIVQSYKERLLAHEKSEQAYKRLVTSLSHDIRTPLATLAGYLEAVTQGIVAGEEKDAYILSALRKSDDLRSYVEVLFEWLRLESGERTYHFEPTDLCEISRELVADFIPSLESRGIAYTVEIPDTAMRVSLDRAAYARIVGNLIGNVMEHSAASKITVQLRSADGCAELCVSDNGRGIGETDLPHVFERLYRCDAARSGRGNGLGLSIVQELTKAHGGRIVAESNPGQRTTFRVTLPFSHTDGKQEK